MYELTSVVWEFSRAHHIFSSGCPRAGIGVTKALSLSGGSGHEGASKLILIVEALALGTEVCILAAS